MNKAILNIDVQDFINSHLNSDISTLLLKGIPFDKIDQKEVVEQIEAKKRSEKKLPTWFNANTIYFPNKLNIEQTSSETTAKYKAGLVSGKSLIDLTGGFGVDAYYFSEQIERITHCEINKELSEIVKYNYSILNKSNIQCLNEDGIEALKSIDKPFDWIYIDPSRRDTSKNKVFLISDCTPDVKKHQDLLFKYTENILIKTSPLLDIKATLSDLHYVKEIHVAAINNEVKELLWVLQKGYNKDTAIKTINFKKSTNQSFDFFLNDESNYEASLSEPLSYLYEPNSAILKAGAFNTISCKQKTPKLHKHSHLYTSEMLVDFPGRCFKIEKKLLFDKKALSSESITKANITTRNFPLSVAEIRKKFKIKNGGDIYLFFTTDIYDSKIVIVCSKDL